MPLSDAKAFAAGEIGAIDEGASLSPLELAVLLAGLAVDLRWRLVIGGPVGIAWLIGFCGVELVSMSSSSRSRLSDGEVRTTASPPSAIIASVDG